MSIQKWSRNIVLVNLPWRLPQHVELQRIMVLVQERGDCSVVVDFSRVDVTGCRTLTRLIELRKLLQDHGHKLVLCGVAPAMKDIFTTFRLDEVFDFVTDRFAALARLQPSS